MQTSYVLQVKKWNLPVAFRICDRVEARYVGTCYRSMGRDISGAALLDPGTIVSQCGMGAAAHRARVHRRRRRQRRLRPARPRDGRRALPARPAGRPRGLPQGHGRRRRHVVERAVDALASTATSVRCMRWILAMATLAAVAALDIRRPGDARHDGAGQPVRTQRRPRRRERGALVPRARRDPAARALAGGRDGHSRERIAISPASPPRTCARRRTTACCGHWRGSRSRAGGSSSERFSWSGRDGWRDLGATRAHCPAVPPEVRSAWRLTRAALVKADRVARGTRTRRAARRPRATRAPPGAWPATRRCRRAAGPARPGARRGGRSPAARMTWSPSSASASASSRGAARSAVASRAREPGSHAAGCSASSRGQRLVEEVVGVGQQAVARLDARDAGGRELEARATARGVDDGDAAGGRVRRLAQQRPGVVDARRLASSRRSTRCTGTPSVSPAVARVVEDVERDGDPALETPTLARIPASVMVAKRAPSTAADHTRQRSGASAYQSQFCASHGPSGLSQRPTVVHSASASSSVRPLSAATSSGSSRAPERERLQLGRERRMPALGALEHARAEAPHVVEPVPEVGEQRQVGVQAERSALGQRRSRRTAALPRIRRVGAQRGERRLGRRGHAAGKRTRSRQGPTCMRNECRLAVLPRAQRTAIESS